MRVGGEMDTWKGIRFEMKTNYLRQGLEVMLETMEMGLIQV